MPLIQLLADMYPTHSSACAVWERAGGRIRDVEENNRPVDRWQTLWRRSVQGASVTPAALLRACWKDNPHNQLLLTSLQRELPNHTEPRTARAAEQLVAGLRGGLADDAELIDALAEWEETDPDRSFAAICPALEGAVVPAQRALLSERLRAPAMQGVVNGAVQAGAAAAVKALLETLFATN